MSANRSFPFDGAPHSVGRVARRHRRVACATHAKHIRGHSRPPPHGGHQTKNPELHVHRRLVARIGGRTTGNAPRIDTTIPASLDKFSMSQCRLALMNPTRRADLTVIPPSTLTIGSVPAGLGFC